nr:MAG TPA: hypothetical protein [Caudoviricetes sp.]
MTCSSFHAKSLLKYSLRMTMCVASFLVPIIEYLMQKIKQYSEIGIFYYIGHIISHFGDINLFFPSSAINPCITQIQIARICIWVFFSVHFFHNCHGIGEVTKSGRNRKAQNVPFKPRKSFMRVIERQEAPRKGW